MVDDNGAVFAQMIRTHRSALATAAVKRQYALATHELPGKASGWDKSIRDMGYHIDYLAESVAADDVSLFEEYVGWARALFSGLGFPETVLANSLTCLREALLAVLPSEAASRAVGYIETAAEHVAAQHEAIPSYVDVLGPKGDLARKYLAALLSGDRQEASRLVLGAVDAGMAIRDVYIHVFQATQWEIGRLWQLNEISVAQEHYCTAATQLIMSQLYPRIFGARRRDRRFVGTCVGGELHELGVRMVADFLEMNGWDTYYLGANVPPQAILSVLAERSVDVLGISATMTFHIQRVTDLINLVRADARLARVKILVGGYPFNISDTLWQTVGADGFASSAVEAVTVANRLSSKG